ncbi:MAG: YggS family pyridoxal phosphate-dependent enzyme [bacterium]
MDWALQERLEEIRNRIAKAAEKAGREAMDITLVAVTKTFPLENACKAYALGIRHFGENRVQEALEKWKDRRPLDPGEPEVFHLVGHLQRNKVRKALQLFDRIDAVDSLELAEALGRVCGELGRVADILIEVNTSGEPQKYGVTFEAAADLAAGIRDLPSLKLRGLMTVGPLTDDISQIETAYRNLKNLFDNLTSGGLCDGTVLSMGMSGDFEIAIAEGATEIRLGTALFGARSNP